MSPSAANDINKAVVCPIFNDMAKYAQNALVSIFAESSLYTFTSVLLIDIVFVFVSVVFIDFLL